jgi:CBS domain-containing protein
MKLEDVMVRDVVTVSPGDGVAVAAKRMRDKSIGSLVVTADGAIKGIVTDRDILKCLTEGHDPYECKIAAHMSRPVIIERPQEDLLRAAEIMSERRIRRLPVVEHGRLVGIVSFSDISRLMDEQAQSFWSTWVSLTRLIRAQVPHHCTQGDRKDSRTALFQCRR